MIEDVASRGLGHVPCQTPVLRLVNALNLFVLPGVGDRERPAGELASFAIKTRLLRERSGNEKLHAPDVHLELSRSGPARVP
ncbi:MAG: hypothetical protein F4145_02495 [Boseongicola sp. SB0675_bin_26]|nr:hypothetical protein [Boseongicola sp. SB0675_bin_26]